MSRIYVASSWRNPWQIGVVQILRAHGHDVYDFREPEPGVHGFAWSDVDPQWKAWKPDAYRTALDHPVAQDGFRRDMDALRDCDACILVLPCGSSAHLELGWAVGAGKQTAILFPHGITTPTGSEGLAAFGHTMSRHGGPCNGCGDLDGCHMPARLDRIEPELMAKCADVILIDEAELQDWSAELAFDEPAAIEAAMDRRP